MFSLATVHTKENPVSCHINSFSLVYIVGFNYLPLYLRPYVFRIFIIIVHKTHVCWYKRGIICWFNDFCKPYKGKTLNVFFCCSYLKLDTLFFKSRSVLMSEILFINPSFISVNYLNFDLFFNTIYLLAACP